MCTTMKSYGHFMQLCVLCLAYVASKTAGAQPRRPIHGRFTRDVSDYERLVPRKVSADGAFQSFDVPHFYDLEEARARPRRASHAEDAQAPSPHVRYELSLGGRAHLVELWPNHGFMAPGLVVERRRRDLWRGDAELRRARTEQCHYVGRVRGAPASRAALSACHDGLAGYVHVGDVKYFVEPEAESRPDASGRHVHVAFRGESALPGRDRRDDRRGDGGGFCGVHGNWRTAWQERFEWEILMNPDFPSVLTNPKSDALRARFLAILVVVDKKFIEFHKEHDSENYILTLMNMVSDYYHDATLGRTLEILVVRIIYLEKEEEELDLTISPDAEKTLESFKMWAQSVNPVDPHHPNHHDIAVMITRYDICAENDTTCSLLGLAPIAVACQPEHAACINEDNGLMTGVTITHEIGHILGCAHDDDEKTNGASCSPLAPDGTTHVMAKTYMMPRTSVWSNCSRRFIGALLDGGMGECLLDEPLGHPYKGLDMPPGAMYDANYQCKITLGLDEVCPWKKDEVCRALWCKSSSKKCTTSVKPAADGTSCGEGKWCFGAECVPVGSRPAAVDGCWGAWGAWSECSRTCGAGVEVMERFCDNPPPQNKGRYCVGERKRYRTCKVEPCDPIQPTFREVQCSEYDDQPFGGRLYTWKPYVNAKMSECELLCYNEVPFFASLSPLVKDGTPCRIGSRDMCVGGQCVAVGCDWILGSSAVEDMCGECGGDASHCKRVDFVYNITNGDRYVEILTVPAGSYNVKVEEKESSPNTIGVSNKCGDKFFLNGNFTEYANGEYMFGKVVGVYSHPEPERESLIIKGPTSEDMNIYIVFYGHPNPGVRVSYYVRNSTGYKPSYEWASLEWGPCSARCGGGSQISLPNCIEKKAGKVSPSFCNTTSKPNPQHRPCNQHKCTARWHTGAWSRCSGCRNHPGKQNRTVECKSDSPTITSEPVLTEIYECSGVQPADTRTCQSDETCEEKCDNIGGNSTTTSLRQSKFTTKSTSNVTTEIIIYYMLSTTATTTLPTSTINSETSPSNKDPTTISSSNGDLIKDQHKLENKNESIFQDTSSTLEHRSTQTTIIAVLMGLTNNDSEIYYISKFNPLRRSVGSPSESHKSVLSSSSSSSSTNDLSPAAISVFERRNICTTPIPDTAVDRFPENQIILKEAPLVGSFCNKSLSEKAEQEMGENLSDTLDTSREKVFKGKEAVQRAKEIKNEQEKEHKLPI